MGLFGLGRTRDPANCSHSFKNRYRTWRTPRYDSGCDVCSKCGAHRHFSRKGLQTTYRYFTPGLCYYDRKAGKR